MHRTRGRADGRSSAATLLLGLLVADLLALQVYVFRELKLAVAERGLPGSPGSFVTVLRETPRPDLLVPVGLLVLVLLAMVSLEVRRRALTDLLMRVTDSPRGALVAAGVCAFVGARYYLDAGIPHQYDAKLHVMRVAEVARQIGDGHWPDWSFSFYGGFPLLRFTGPLYYVSAALCGLAAGSVSAGVTIVLTAAHVGGALVVFALVRRLGGSPRAAFLGAVGSAISFQHAAEVASAGRHPVALLYVFFPLLLLAGESVARRYSLRGSIGFGLAAAGLLLSHPGLAPYGVLVGVLYVAMRALANRGRRAAAPTALGLAVAGIVGVVLGAWLVLPALAERTSVHLARMYTTTGIGIDWSPDLHQISRIARWSFLWSGTSVTYVGASLIALFLLATVRRGHPRALRAPLGVTALVLLFLVGGGYLSARSVHFLVPVLAVGAGLALDVLPRRFVPLAVLVVLLDLGPTTFQSPFRPDLEDDRAFVARAAEAAEGHRILRVSRRNDRYAVSEWASVYDVDVAMITGPFREGAAIDMYPWILDLLERTEADLNGPGTLSDETVRALRRFGVRLVVFEDGQAPFVPDPGHPDLTRREDVPALEVRDPGVALGVVAREDLGRPDVLDGPPIPVRQYRRTRREIRFRCRTETDGMLVLSLADLPGLRVRIDGTVRAPEYGPYGLATFEVEAGDHLVEAGYAASPIVRGLRTVSLVALAAFLVVVAVPRRRRPRQSA